MNVEDIFNRLSNAINKNRPADRMPVVFIPSDDEKEQEDPSKSPLWTKNVKKTVITSLMILGLLCLFFLRNMIIPLILSCLMVFYLKPIVFSIQDKWHISHKAAVIIVFGIFLIVAMGILAAGGFSIYGQVMNLFDTIDSSVDNLPDMVLELLGGENTFAGRYFLQIVGISQNSELNQQLEKIMQSIGSGVLSFLQSFSSKIGWFFFIFGFSFFIVWEAKKNDDAPKMIKIPGYDYA